MLAWCIQTCSICLGTQTFQYIDEQITYFRVVPFSVARCSRASRSDAVDPAFGAGRGFAAGLPSVSASSSSPTTGNRPRRRGVLARVAPSCAPAAAFGAVRFGAGEELAPSAGVDGVAGSLRTQRHTLIPIIIQHTWNVFDPRISLM